MIKNNLSRILGERRMTQRELTRITGIAPSSVMKLYHGESKYIYFETLEKICTALHITMCDLFEIVPDKV
jgi:putative transcriptional regulator